MLGSLVAVLACVWIPEAEHADLIEQITGGAETDSGTDDGTETGDTGCELQDWFRDGDSDGYGDPGDVTAACTLPTGHSALDTDCDDTDGDVHPGVAETCNDVDDDCDDAIDEEPVDGLTYFLDADDDGAGTDASTTVACAEPDGSWSLTGGDCDDEDDERFPGQDERCNDVDDDCDDDGDVDAVDAATWYLDADTDGWGRDDDSLVQCDAPDGYVDTPGDCDDEDVEVHPEADEVCDGIDNDCDDSIDVGALDLLTFYADTDGDGYGDADSTIEACDLPTGYVSDTTDCDDTLATTYPGADEYCGGGDENCDSVVDEDSAVDAPLWYTDSDSDGYGAGEGVASCTAPADLVASGDDCDDDDAAISPVAPETCDNGVDDDCDGDVDDDCGPVGALNSGDADAWMVGATPDMLGQSFSVSPDITGDGAPDLVVAANDSGLYVVPGPTSGEMALGSLPSVATADRFLVHAGGDYDGDGYGDVLSVGWAGANYLYYGPIDTPGMAEDSDAISTGIQNAALADLDADDDAELVIVSGSYLYLDAGPTVGVNNTWSSGGSTIGGVLATGADLGGDGIPDFVVGDGSTSIQVLNGAEIDAGSSFGDVSEATLTDSTSSDFGSDVVLLPDADGDGYGDILVGARYADLTYTNAGAAWLISGPPTAMTSIAGACLTGGTASDYAGTSVGTADIDGDAISDVLVGGATSPNQAWLYYGPFTAGTYDLDLADATFSGFVTNNLALSGADLEGSGFDTLIIGDGKDTSGGTTAGAIWFYYGGNH